MKVCVGCGFKITDIDEEENNVVDVSGDLGGGVLHRACWELMKPWIRRLCNEVLAPPTPTYS